MFDFLSDLFWRKSNHLENLLSASVLDDFVGNSQDLDRKGMNAFTIVEMLSDRAPKAALNRPVFYRYDMSMGLGYFLQEFGIQWFDEAHIDDGGVDPAFGQLFRSPQDRKSVV